RRPASSQGSPNPHRRLEDARRRLRACRSCVSFALVTRQALAQLRELAATDGERLGFPAQLEHVAIVVADALERFDVRDRDENAAVRAHEVAFELLFELLQRLVDEVLAAAMTNGDVFLIRAKVANLLDGHELELVADADGD